MAVDVMAIDPGKTTGVAMWADGHFSMGYEEADWNVVAEDVEKLSPDVVVMERYTINSGTAKKSRQYEALYLIGTVLYLRRDDKITAVQGPAEAKTFSTDEKLKRVGFWTPGRGHANDAARHLLLYLVKAKLIRPEEVLDAD